MIVARLLGYLIFLAGLCVLVRDGLVWLDTGRWAPLSLGMAWHDVDRASLDLAQAAVERYVAAVVWDPVIVSLLALWACVVLIAIGAAILYLSRRSSSARR